MKTINKIVVPGDLQPGYQVRNRRKKSWDRKTRAAAYCRVSTLLEEQELSFENQVEYYKAFIESQPDMELVDIYGDHGASGLRAQNREQFQKMIQDALDGKIDVIYTKSVSRLARNAIECQKVLDLLNKVGVYVYFENEGIKSNDPKFRFLLKVLQSIVQEQSNSQSQSIIWTVDNNAALGRPAYKCCFGYVKNNIYNKKIAEKERHAWSINEEEAKMVRTMFDMIEDGYSTYDVANRMTEMDVERGKNFVWKSAKVCWMLRNIAYKGDILTHKTVVRDYLAGKAVKNEGYRKQYYLKDHHPAIITEEQFETVQEILDERSRSWKERRAI